MRTKFIAGNWKMYKDVKEAAALATALKLVLKDVTDVDVAVCPPFVDIYTVAQILKDTNIKVGAQNMYPKTEGAFTGEISPLMLRSAGCEYVIIGHSERRQYFKESNEEINTKVKFALECNLLPILCVGETLEEREKGIMKEVVKSHLTGGLKDITADKAVHVTIAYEPVWAIGTGKTASPEQAQEVHAYIRELLKGLYDEKTSQTIRIQYGGSVKPGNAKELMSKPDIDGALVGGAALKAEDFEGIIKYNK
ncbi:MAG: triose-phosphate isomerase [bacterium]